MVDKLTESIDAKVEIVARLWREMAGTIQRSGSAARLDIEVPMAQMRVLFVLAQSRTPISIGQIAEELGIGMPAASRLVERLIQEQLATRSEDPLDRRRTLVQLTEKGAALIDGITAAIRERILSILRQLRSEDLDALLRGLQAVAEVIMKTEEKEPTQKLNQPD